MSSVLDIIDFAGFLLFDTVPCSPGWPVACNPLPRPPMCCNLQACTTRPSQTACIQSVLYVQWSELVGDRAAVWLNNNIKR